MSILSTSLRKQLEKCIREARIVAQDAAADAIRRMAVAPPDAPAGISAEHKSLRVRLRAHGRTLGDTLDAKRSQTTVRLREAAAYEIWHRLLFARFLVERGLLLHPDLGAPLTLAELAELAPDEGAKDAWTLAERYAAATLPAVFKPDDPVLALPLDPYHHNQLQGLVTGLDPAVFEASDSLGWTYQFWRAAEKDAVNKEGGKIGAVELPAVTQLFTEAYMVHFLLHNTLGAWWAGKVLSANSELARDATDEAALRAACALPEINWEYLRFVRDPANSGSWQPAAGSYPGWPDRAATITLLDPCCGSGHFLVEALPIVAAIRRKEEGLTADQAVRSVLRDNLHGLEIDGRCVQIAAFSVALAAWQIAGAPVALPNPHLAWVGAPPPLPRSEMAALANGDITLRRGMEALHDQFVQAPLLGSLMDVTRGDLLDSDWRFRQGEALAKLVVRVNLDEPERAEGAVAAQGLLDALDLLSREYTLQITNVPFLGYRDMGPELLEWLRLNYESTKGDLGYCLWNRLFRISKSGGAVAVVTLQHWLSTVSYERFRKSLLTERSIELVAHLGTGAFETISGEKVNVTLSISRALTPDDRKPTSMMDCSNQKTIQQKKSCLKTKEMVAIPQSHQLKNPSHTILFEQRVVGKVLSEYALCLAGIMNGDTPRFTAFFWEVSPIKPLWTYLQSTVSLDYA